MHPNSSEYSDYSIAMRSENYKKMINKLRNSTTEFSGSPIEQITGVLNTFSAIYFHNGVDINTRDNFINYPLSLACEAITKIIENNKITIIDINKVFKDLDLTEPNISTHITKLKNHSLNIIDLKRLEINHSIINKRFHFDQTIIKERHVKDSACRSGFPIPFYLDVCKKLDTYNLELPEKINLMVEELAYLMANVAQPRLNDDSDIKWMDNFKYIIPTVIMYIFNVYSSSTDIPYETKLKVLKAAYNKLLNSYYINHFEYEIGMRGYLSFLDKPLESTDLATTVFVKYILNLELSGKINTKEGFVSLFGKRIIDSEDCFTVMNYRFMFLYYYGIFTNEIKEMGISIPKLIIHWYNNGNFNADQFEYAKKMVNMFSTFAQNIKLNLDDENNNDIKERTLNVLNAIYFVNTKISNLMYIQSVNKNKSVNEIKPKYDKEDFTGYFTPGETSDYEKKLISSFKVFDDLESKMESLDTNAFIDLTLNKDVVLEAGHEYVQSLRKLIMEHIDLFDADYLYESLTKTKKEISETLSVQPTHENYSVSNSIYAFIAVVDNYRLFFESESIKNITNKFNTDIQLEDYDASSDLSDTLLEISKNTSSVANLVYTMNDVLSVDSMQEMKLSSYATMIIDKVKKGVQYLDDKQKEAFVTIDRIADSVDHWDDKEEKAEARIQVVKGKMLPSLSKCIKAILTAGALSFVSIYLGILYLVIKYVSAKNAVAGERQAVCDELEVEVQMIDRKIQEAVDDKNFKEERKLRLLKKKILTHFAKISYDNATKWNNSIIMKPEADNQGQKFGLREE